LSQADVQNNQPKESFAELLDQSFQEITSLEGSVVTGTVLSIEKDMILIDVGLKSEGRVPIREFGNNDDELNIKVGDQVEVFIERLEDANGQAILSREK
jgi:small subunit ribosomal protein S1